MRVDVVRGCGNQEKRTETHSRQYRCGEHSRGAVSARETSCEIPVNVEDAMYSVGMSELVCVARGQDGKSAPKLPTFTVEKPC